MARFEQCASVIILARDKDSIGSVEYGKDENVVTHYILSEHDRKSILEGLIRAANITVASGAREVITAQIGVDFFKFDANEESSVNDPRFLTWIEYGLPDHSASIMSAHQMGSNRMGISPQTSVVKPTGETWEVKNLYVADASVFPTASGVNPMVTIEAIALHIADSILNYAKPKL